MHHVLPEGMHLVLADLALKERLSIEIRRGDRVGVPDNKPANAFPCQSFCHLSIDSASPDEPNRRLLKSSLTEAT
jgi:hypothetical protein